MLRKLKNPLVVAIIILATNSITYAQIDSLRAPSQQQKSEVIAYRMQRELSLTTKQTQQVTKLVMDRLSNLKAQSTSTSVQKETINEQSRQKLSTILTKEQYAQYLSLRQQTQKQKDEYLEKNPGYIFSDEDKELDF